MNPEEEAARVQMRAASAKLADLFVPETRLQWAGLALFPAVYVGAFWVGLGAWGLLMAFAAVFALRASLDLCRWLRRRARAVDGTEGTAS